MPRHPSLHRELVALSAPTQAWSDVDGQVLTRSGVLAGFFHSDTRVLAHCLMLVDGGVCETIASWAHGDTATFVYALPDRSESGTDPLVQLTRVRTVRPGEITETFELTAGGSNPVECDLRVTIGTDLATMGVVRGGQSTELVRPELDQTARWRTGVLTVEASALSARVSQLPNNLLAFDWSLTAQPGAPESVSWALHATDTSAVVAPAAGPAPWHEPATASNDARLPRLMQAALADLDRLRMSTPGEPADEFLAAGAPWYFTLFGRDSLWAARMLLPLGTELAAGTLRTLAARQGRVEDPASGEQPGKILHELRAHELRLDENVVLPAQYYGTIDATALWISLLHDAWRAGMPSDQVHKLLPALQAALGWLADYGDADGDGFLEYHDTSGRGLVNQGWKDSPDAIQFRDGRHATGPIALVEVQAYAYAAAVAGADLLAHFGLDGASGWRQWAAQLADRFRATFWLTDDAGPYLGVGLDRDKRVVDSVTSNMGHVLGSGILTAEEARIIADRLVAPDMNSGFGLRTMSTASSGYWPWSYHCGSVWPHDTAIVAAGMAREGLTEQAAILATGLLDAAEHFDFRLPELFAGQSAARPIPYPAACRPQAWSAASALVIHTILAR